MRIGKTYTEYLKLKLKTVIYSEKELEKHLVYCSDTRFIEKINELFESDKLQYKLIGVKERLYQLKKTEG